MDASGGRQNRRRPVERILPAGADRQVNQLRPELLAERQANRLRTGVSQIFVMRSDGTHERQLTHSPVSVLGASYSPNGKRIVFETTAGGDTEIAVMRADGSHAHPLTNNSVDDHAASWQPKRRP
jgi:hypothetical protein